MEAMMDDLSGNKKKKGENRTVGLAVIVLAVKSKKYA
jgi:hypothetical protein